MADNPPVSGGASWTEGGPVLATTSIRPVQKHNHNGPATFGVGSSAGPVLSRCRGLASVVNRQKLGAGPGADRQKLGATRSPEAKLTVWLSS